MVIYEAQNMHLISSVSFMVVGDKATYYQKKSFLNHFRKDARSW